MTYRTATALKTGSAFPYEKPTLNMYPLIHIRCTLDSSVQRFQPCCHTRLEKCLLLISIPVKVMNENEKFSIIPDNSSSPLAYPQHDYWVWNPNCKSCDAHIADNAFRSVIFHPTWSEGTSAIRGTKVLNNTRSFWEIIVNGGLGGTSTMFGIGTNKSCLGTNTFCDLIGKDEHSWGLSHRGLIWHSGNSEKYCRPFRENFSTTIGLLFDGIYGTLTYFKDGVNLGVAFRGLNEIGEPLYPIVSSTSMRSLMTLRRTEQEFISLQDRCKAVILRHWESKMVENLHLPIKIQKYLAEVNEYRCSDCEWYVPRF